MKTPEQTQIGITIRAGEMVKDVVVVFGEQTRVDEIRSAIDRNLRMDTGELDVLVERTGEVLPATALVADCDLLHGDVVALVGEGRSGETLEARLVPISPDLPHIALGAGEAVTLGRTVSGPGTARLDDPTVSGRHARLVWNGSEALRVEDLDSRNGTWVNGTRIEGFAVLRTGDRVEFGDESAFTVELPDDLTTPGHVTRASGVLEFTRPPRIVDQLKPVTVEIPPAPEKPKLRRLPWPMIVSPVVLGLVMFVFFESPMYLLFTAMGPVMALWNWAEGRKTAARDYRAAAESYEEHLRQARRTLLASRRSRESKCLQVFPDPGGLAQIVRPLSSRLWERRPSHDDFLVVRLGLGDVASEDAVHVAETGEPVLLEKSLALQEAFRLDRSAPVRVGLRDRPVLGLVADDSRGLATWLAIQLAAYHSPRDLAIAFLAPEHELSWRWAKWLPHVQEAERLGIAPLPKTAAETRQAFKALRDLVASRQEASSARWQTGTMQNRSLVVIAEPPFDLKAAEVSSFLQTAGDVGISVIWLSDSDKMLPGECSAFIRVHEGSASFVEVAGGSGVDEFVPDAMTDPEPLARRLAPLRDVTTASDTSSLPKSVGLFDVLELDAPTPEAFVESWQTHAEDFVAPVGVDGSTVVTLDLAATGDGAHGLVAGTTGGGKSEFLRSLVASLAYRYPPTYLTFLFVDYKGGAAFRDCVELPHTVGVLTNLDDGLADRARRSLAAELDYRQRLFDHYGVQDLDQMRSVYPDDAPPYLLVVFDEFASLVQEMPEFIDGVIDIAQRGRSLGMHLILATQTPGGVVNRKIQNCVNFRVAFRLREASESSEVIKAPDAENIPSAIPGRGFLRAGDNSLTLFQSAYAMARSAEADEGVATAHTMVLGGRRSAQGGKAVDETIPTDLRRMVDAAREAATMLGLSEPRRPWLPELPEILGLGDEALSGVGGGKTIATVGMTDLPDRQLQVPYRIDFPTARNVLLFGGGSSGKTTALRSIAAALASSYSTEEVNIYGLDFASHGLVPLESLPHVGGIAQGDDVARVRNLMATLQRIVDERRGRVGGDGAPHVVVLIDGLVPLLALLEGLDGGHLFQEFQQLMVDGPASGLYFVVATDQPQRIPSTIANVAGERLVFRLANRDAYAAAGVDASASRLLGVSGRAWSTRENAIVQIAVASDSQTTDEAAQLQAIQALARSVAGQAEAPLLRVLPERIEPAEVLGVEVAPGTIVLGLDDQQLMPVEVDFSRTPSVLVIGSALSGKTSTLRWIRDAFLATTPGVETVCLAPSREPAVEHGWMHCAFGWDEAGALLESVAESLGRRDRWLLIAIDDADDFAEVPIGAPRDEQLQFQRFSEPLERILKDARSSRVAVVAAGRFSALTRLQGWGMRMRREEQAVMLATVGLGSMAIDPFFGARIPRRSDYRPTAGRGVLIRGGSGTFMQVVWPGNPPTQVATS